MEMFPVIIEVCFTFVLMYVYYILCAHRKVGTIGKVIEIVSLYGITILAFMDKIKIVTWFIGIAAIGTIKILTTKKQKRERQNI